MPVSLYASKLRAPVHDPRYIAPIDSGIALDECANGMGSKVVWPDLGERSAVSTDRRPDRIANEGFYHFKFFSNLGYVAL